MERYNYEQDESYIKRLLEYIKKLEEENKKLRNQLQVREDTRVEQLNFVREENKKLKAELELHKKQYKHSMGEDYIDEDLYDLDC